MDLAPGGLERRPCVGSEGSEGMCGIRGIIGIRGHHAGSGGAARGTEAVGDAWT